MKSRGGLGRVSSSLAFIVWRSFLLRSAPHYLNAWNRLNSAVFINFRFWHLKTSPAEHRFTSYPGESCPLFCKSLETDGWIKRVKDCVNCQYCTKIFKRKSQPHPLYRPITVADPDLQILQIMLGGSGRGQSFRSWDKGRPISNKTPFGPQFGQKIRGEPGPRGPRPLDLPLHHLLT